MISIKSLVKKYKNEKKIAYRDYTFEDYKSYIILGASGCGKSTLLNMICGLLYVDKGSITIDNQEISSLSQEAKDNYRIKNIGYIFQDFKLLNNMSVKDNIDVLRIENVDVSKTNYYLDKLGILDKKNKKIKNLSGGEKQRVAIVRALVKSPNIILADEPTGNLNFEIGEEVIKCLMEVTKGKTLIAVSHDERLTKYFDVALRMDDLLLKEGEY